MLRRRDRLLALMFGLVLAAFFVRASYVSDRVPFNCIVAAGTTTTKVCQALTAAGRPWVSEVTMSNNAGTSQTLQVVYGTKTTTDCDTGQTALTHPIQFGAAVGNWDHSYGNQPLQGALVSSSPFAQICVVPGAGTSYAATIAGYITPN